jgi:predicted  nucleic acid-binding Zn-ribbon protein
MRNTTNRTSSTCARSGSTVATIEMATPATRGPPSVVSRIAYRGPLPFAHRGLSEAKPYRRLGRAKLDPASHYPLATHYGRHGMEDIRSLEDLLDLQTVDSEIDRLLEQRGSLPILAEYRAANSRSKRLAADIASRSAHLREVDLAEDKIEGEMRIDEEKLGREERRLYAGGLSARDAGHLRDEVTMLRTRISTREDEALALIAQREALQTEIDELESRRGGTVEHESRLEGEIQREWARIDEHVSRLREKRDGITPMIDAALVELYEEIRPSKEGVAAAPLVDGVCGGCHLRLSAAERSQALKAHPPRCVHCQRILSPR